ncbi:MAG: DUF4230 domain-containing protein [Verrucomicrobiae bacterium]|nr:DUF4230 domain-containing protein [Verrucomicrobiae bacterium]
MVSPSDPWFLPALVVAALLVLGLGFWAVWRIIHEAGRAGVAVVKASGDAATQVAEGLARVLRDTFNLQPRVRVGGETRIEPPQSTRELVLVKQSLERCHDWTHQRLWSTKRMEVSARFTVSVGFDLSQPLDIEVDRTGRRARVTLPHPRILSVHLDTIHPARENGGLWNRITPEDRAAAHQELQRVVEEDARQSGLLEMAEAELRRVLSEEMWRQGGEIEFHAPPALPPPDPTGSRSPAGS